MKNIELRSALTKSGIFLVLCVFFIYAFASNDSGGITGTIGSLFSGIIFLVGITIAIVVSIVVIFAIYFGILFMYDQETCSKTYGEFKAKLSASSQLLSCPCPSHSTATDQVPAPAETDEIGPLRTRLDKADNKLAELSDGVSTLKESVAAVTASVADVAAEVTALQEKNSVIDEKIESCASTEAIDESAKKLSADIASLQGTVKPLADKLSELEAAIAASADTGEEEEGEDVQALIDTAVASVQSELTAIQSKIEELAAQPKPATAEPAEEPEADESGAHRILSYFTKKADENKFVSLVKKAVDQKMTYAQAGELLSDSLSAAAAEVIDDHPSLTKDYIKTIKNGS